MTIIPGRDIGIKLFASLIVQGDLKSAKTLAEANNALNNRNEVTICFSESGCQLKSVPRRGKRVFICMQEGVTTCK